MKTIILLFMICLICISTACMNMKNVYLKEKKMLIEKNKLLPLQIFTNELIKDLPEVLKKYLKVCGYIDRPVPKNANIYWSESWLKMASDKDWSELSTIQFNSVDPIGRIAYMKFLSMPVAGRDIYYNGYGEMKGKLLNLFNVVNDNSKEIAQSALITTFCEFIFVPGYLLSEKVQWEQLDEHSVKGTLQDAGIKVSGIFYFNQDGLFTHFITDDRYYSIGKNNYRNVRFTAIVDSYKTQGDITIVEKIRALWNLPEGDYEYFKGIVDRIEINVVE